MVNDSKCIFENCDPDFIYNRFDLMDPANSKIYTVSDREGDYSLTLHMLSDEEAELGLWLNPISKKSIKKILHRIFREHKSLKRLKYKNSYLPIGCAKETNHFRIVLPKTVEELDERLSSKGRYNIKREKRLLERDFSAYHVEEYTIDNLPEPVADVYYTMKKETHKINYDIPAAKFIRKQHVTSIYTLHVGNESKIIAMILSCEQCPVVYLENLTYDIEYAKYSPGQILYDIYLKRLIEKGKRQIFLLGGKYEYKKRYGSIEETVYNGLVERITISYCRTKMHILIYNCAIRLYNAFPAKIRKSMKAFLGRK